LPQTVRDLVELERLDQLSAADALREPLEFAEDARQTFFVRTHA
jgi:hypothetical protein